MADEQPQDAAPKKKRILLVDDDREIVESMRIALEADGLRDPRRPRRQPGPGHGRARGSRPGDPRHDDAQAERLSGAGEAAPHAAGAACGSS